MPHEGRAALTCPANYVSTVYKHGSLPPPTGQGSPAAQLLLLTNVIEVIVPDSLYGTGKAQRHILRWQLAYLASTADPAARHQPANTSYHHTARR